MANNNTATATINVEPIVLMASMFNVVTAAQVVEVKLEANAKVVFDELKETVAANFYAYEGAYELYDALCSRFCVEIERSYGYRKATRLLSFGELCYGKFRESYIQLNSTQVQNAMNYLHKHQDADGYVWYNTVFKAARVALGATQNVDIDDLKTVINIMVANNYLRFEKNKNGYITFFVNK